DLGAAFELAADPGLVEPGGPHVSGLVADFDPDHRQFPFAERPRRVAHHGYEDRAGFAWLERLQRADLAVAVGPREAVEQVTDGGDPRPPGGVGQFRADPVEGLQPGLEHARARPVDRRIAQFGAGRPADPGETPHLYCAASSHHQLGWPPSCFSSSTPSGTWASTWSSGIGASAPPITVTISASTASISTVANSVDPAPPQATISPPEKPTASPRLNRPWASSRAAGAMPPVATSASAASSRPAFSSSAAAGSSSTSARRLACCEV